MRWEMAGVTKALLVYFVTALFLIHASIIGGEDNVPSMDNFYYYPGDVLLGGLFPIHFSDNDGCGAINPFRGVQNLGSIIFALDNVNEILVPSTGTRLGMVAMDSCFNDDKALEKSLTFAQNRFLGKTLLPPLANLSRDTNINAPFRDKIIGILGATSSGQSVKVATLMKLFKLPQISYFSTSPELSKPAYSFFMRTVPSDVYQAKALIAILQKFEWLYASLVAEDSSYGDNFAAILEEIGNTVDVCFGYKGTFSEKTTDSALHQLSQSLLRHPNSKGTVVVVLVARYNLAMKLIKAVGELTLHKNTRMAMDQIQWIASDGWTGIDMPTEIVQFNVRSIGATSMTESLPGFLPYFKGLAKREANKGKPWLIEYWEFKFNCTFNYSSSLKKNCTGDEDFNGDHEITEYKVLYNGRNAVYSYGQAIMNMFESMCNDTATPCPSFSKALAEGETLLRYLKAVKDPINVTFSFVNETEGPAKYSIQTFLESKSWEPIGNYTGSDGLQLSDEVNHVFMTSSVCSEGCPPHSFRRRKRNKQCCWTCKTCGVNEYVNNSDPYTCVSCKTGFTTNTNDGTCVPIPTTSMSYSHPLTIFICTICSIGIIATVFTFIIFIIYRDTPIVKASSIGTSIVLLSGILFSFMGPFFINRAPSVATCSLIRIFLGLSYTIGYSAIFAKLYMLNSIFTTMRTSVKLKKGKSRIFKRGKVLPVHAFALAVILILTHLLFILSWIVINIPSVNAVLTQENGAAKNVLVCSDGVRLTYIGELVWPFGLMIVCIGFALKLRKLPKAFNEKSSIVYCTSISFILWVIFVPVFAHSEDNVLRAVTLSFSLFFHGSLLLITLFARKVYIMLFRPSKNTRESVMGPKLASSSPSETGGARPGSGGRPSKLSTIPSPDSRVESTNYDVNEQTTNEYIRMDNGQTLS